MVLFKENIHYIIVLAFYCILTNGIAMRELFDEDMALNLF